MELVVFIIVVALITGFLILVLHLREIASNSERIADVLESWAISTGTISSGIRLVFARNVEHLSLQ